MKETQKVGYIRIYHIFSPERDEIWKTTTAH